MAAKNSKTDIAAKEAFERLENQPVPQAAELYQCVVTQVGVIKTGRSQRALAFPRDAYCRFLLALVTADRDQLLKSPSLLKKAEGNGQNNMAPLLEILSSLASLKNGAQDASTISAAIARVECTTVEFVNAKTCASILDAARIWSGHMEGADQRSRARKSFEAAGNSGWLAFEDGMSALEARQWHQAAGSLNAAANEWSSGAGPTSLTELLAPQPNLPAVLGKLTYAQFMDGNLEGALAAADRAIAANPSDSNSLFLRARIREILGLSGPAMVDLKAAAKFDKTHFFEGVLLLRTGRTKEAAEAFAEAPGSAPDLAAWSLFAQGCEGPLDRMEAAAKTASPIFPATEASRVALECRFKTASTLEQLVAMDAALHNAYADRTSRERVSNAYLKFGLDAEDHQDGAKAVAAYSRAIEWSPLNTKARFNLAAIYVGDRKFDLAETQYRALLEADSTDHESQFWLAQCLLLAQPDAPRKSEACALLSQAMQIPDAERRAQFAAVSAASCGN